MPPKIQKSKEAKLLAALSASKGKGKKKKWAKGKLREKKDHRVVFNKALFDKFITEVPKKMKVITIYSLVEQFKINGSLARRGIQELVKRGSILPVAPSGAYCVYTRSAKAEAAAKSDAANQKKSAPKAKAKKVAKAAEAEAEETAE